MPATFERHPNKRGTWIAYDADGLAFRVDRYAPHCAWSAHPSYAGNATDTRTFRADTLRQVAALVAASHKES